MLDEVAEAHRDFVRAGIDAPAAPGRKDGALWHIDLHAPADAEAEFQRRCGEILDRNRR